MSAYPSDIAVRDLDNILEEAEQMRKEGIPDYRILDFVIESVDGVLDQMDGREWPS